MKLTKEDFFKRQTTLPEIGKQGQERLQNAKVLIIGCGGLGSPAAVYLAASGIGLLHLVDFDTVSASNLHRQIFYNVDSINTPKVEQLADEISKKAPFTKVTFTNNAIAKNSILELMKDFDVVVDGTDSLPIKYLINDACVLSKKPLVYGSLYKFDGYVATFNVNENKGFSTNLRDAFPEIATDIPNCEDAGTMNPIVGIIALLQVNEVIKLITKTGKLLSNQLLIYNALENSQFKMKLKKNKSLNIKEIFKSYHYLDKPCKVQDPKLLISSSDFKKRIDDRNLEIVSVINNLETKIPFKVKIKKPFQSFDYEGFNPDFNKNYVIVCNKGITSYTVTLNLKKKYPLLSVLSLVGGIQKFN